MLLSKPGELFISPKKLGNSPPVHRFPGDKNNTTHKEVRLEKCLAKLQANKKKARRQSQTTGVSWNKSSEKWQVRVSLDGKQRSIGYFVEEADAVALVLMVLDHLDPS